MKHFIPLILLLAFALIADVPTVSPKEDALLRKLETISPKQAIEILRKEMTPTSSLVLHFTLAQRLVQTSQHKEASECLQKILKKKSDFHEARLLLAQVYATLEDFDSSARELTTMITSADAPRDHAIWAMLAQAHLKNQQPIAAETAIRQALTIQPNNDTYLRILLNALLMLEESQRAASIARKLLNTSPQDELLWLAILNPFLETNRLQDANDLLTTARITIPKSTRLLQLHVNVLLQLNNPIQAAKELKDRQVTAPEHPDLLIATVQVLLRNNNREDAQQLLRSLPQNLTPTQEIKAIKLKLKTEMTADTEQNLKAWHKVLALNPHDPEASLEAARLLRKSHRQEEAKIFLEQSLRENPSHYDAWLELADLHLQENHNSLALKALQKAYPIFPSQELLNAILQLQKKP